MTTENEVTEQPNQTVENEVTTDPISDIVSRYNIEETANQFRQTQPTETQVTPQPQVKPNVPDPYDSDAMRNYLAQQAMGTTALQSQVQALSGALNQIQMERVNARLEGDIQAAVKAVDEIAGLGKPKLVEAYLDGKVREDSRLKAIWDNRERNPKALQEALKVIGNEIAKEFSVKTDPKLVEAQRARKAAQSTQATTQGETADEAIQSQIDKAGGFDRYWSQLVGSMN